MGVYASFDDVAARFEGELPAEQEDWVVARIDDVEAELFWWVPALADGAILVTDPARAARVRRLICEKVLALYRNPDGAMAVTVSSDMGLVKDTETRTISRTSHGSWLSFTDDELARVGYVYPAGATGSVILRAYHYDPLPINVLPPI